MVASGNERQAENVKTRRGIGVFVPEQSSVYGMPFAEGRHGFRRPTLLVCPNADG